MTIRTDHSRRFSDAGEVYEELDRFERISHRHQAECPVRSHAAKTRGRMRSRSSSAARLKARTINGAHRRGRQRYLSPGF